MERRKFIKNLSTLGAAPLLLNGTMLSTTVTQAMLPMLMNCDLTQDRSVVVLFLKGGNDGLNTIVPFDQYDAYVGHRPDIALELNGSGALLALDSTMALQDQVAIHPAISSLKAMYEQGRARIVQAVGYPSPNQSHFKSTDLWLSGNDGDSVGAGNRCGGWIGRFLEVAYPGVHGVPTVQQPDPLGIQLGDSKPTLAFHDCSSEYNAVNLSWQDPASLFGLISGLGTLPHAGAPGTDYGDKLAHIMAVENSTSVYSERITAVYNAGSNGPVSYPNTNLGNDFSTVARMLSGGSKTKIFQLHRDGFDTHNNQVESADPEQGRHADRLEDVFESIKAFHDDLATQGLGQKVVTVVFSEFSRRITQNGNLGTDHGNFGPMFVFGEGIEPGVSGTNLDLSAVSVDGYLDETEMQYDYRSVFKTLLQDWLGAGDDILDPAELNGFPIMSELIREDQKVTPDCYLVPAVVCPTDFNGDGVTDTEDFLMLNSTFGADCDGCRTDLDGNGTVDTGDFLLFNSAFGQDCD